MTKAFRALLQVAGLPRFRLYDLRHTFATHLLAQGAPLTYVAAQLGHTKPTTTLAWYAHWIPAGGKHHVDDLGAAREATAETLRATVPAPRWRGTRLEYLEEPGAGGGSRTRDLLITNRRLNDSTMFMSVAELREITCRREHFDSTQR